jgi:hypothetical protein
VQVEQQFFALTGHKNDIGGGGGSSSSGGGGGGMGDVDGVCQLLLNFCGKCIQRLDELEKQIRSVVWWWWW